MWTNNKPTEAGYYWVRGAGWDEHVVRVEDGEDGLEMHEHSGMGWEHSIDVVDITPKMQWKPCIAP